MPAVERDGAARRSEIRVLVGTWDADPERSRRPPARRGPRAQRRLRALQRRRAATLLTLLNDAPRSPRASGAARGWWRRSGPTDGPPTWVVTGTDAAGVGAAAELLGEQACATATRSPPSGDGEPIGVPVPMRPALAYAPGPQPVAPGLARRRDRLPRQRSPRSPSSSRARSSCWPVGVAVAVCRVRRRGPARGGRLAAAGAAAAGADDGGQRARLPPRRDGPASGLGAAGARQHRRHPRVARRGRDDRAPGRRRDSRLRGLLGLRRSRPRSARAPAARPALGADRRAGGAPGAAGRRGRPRVREAATLRGPAAAPVGRAALARRLVEGSLDRAVDVAATLELRGHSLPGRRGPPREPLAATIGRCCRGGR